ncbi:hypothetical protein A1O7_08218 [Cladophialophora yegresii CBS 114405]|uniref:Secreted protein n=1 Tax=Cladophialophora yegresii CBS 114405 TaxID=1182544 RepID=W9VSY2_9EURO|nr:uncharacterized protein A1O7_08218 [Cladophialophora yegresii CBS 114405]EXJ55291.1 hypothetical protein A1O7_08218 [Cladophialophora yegresii CBS 114405]
MHFTSVVRALFLLFLTIEAAPTPQTAGASGGDLSTLSGVSGPETSGDNAAFGGVANSGDVTAANAGDVGNAFSGNNNTTDNPVASDNEIVPVTLGLP